MTSDNLPFGECQAPNKVLKLESFGIVCDSKVNWSSFTCFAEFIGMYELRMLQIHFDEHNIRIGVWNSADTLYFVSKWKFYLISFLTIQLKQYAHFKWKWTKNGFENLEHCRESKLLLINFNLMVTTYQCWILVK